MNDGNKSNSISSNGQRLRRIFAQVSTRRRWQFGFLILLSMVAIAAELLTIGAVLPLLYVALQPEKLSSLPLAGDIIGTVSDQFGISPLASASALLAIAAVLATVARLAIQWYAQKLVFALNGDLSATLFGRMLRQPFEWHAHHHSSMILSAMEKVYEISIGVVLPLVNALTAFAIATFIIILLFSINPVAAALAAAVVGLVYAILIYLTKARTAVASSRSATLRDSRYKALQESSGGIRDIVLDQTQPIFERRFATLDRQFNREMIWHQLVLVLPRIIVEGTLIVLIALLALWFNRQPGGLTAALPALGAIAIGAQRLLPLVQQVYAGYGGYAFAIGNIDDVLDMIEAPIDDSFRYSDNVDPLPFQRDIEFCDVSFTYLTSKRAVHGVDLTIRAGQRVGIIGKTGSGKSTFADLLMGLLRPSNGRILIDGTPLSDQTVARWKKQIAHVPQHIFLSDDSIAANIAFGCQTTDLAKVRSCLEQAGLGEWVEGLPEGVNTFVGERGIRLSGGQRQRIGIARALYKESRLLVLDEATSSLDSETEAFVMDAVNALRTDLTIVIIAHRLSTIASCDTIVRIDHGKVIEVGTYNDVVGKSRDAKS